MVADTAQTSRSDLEHDHPDSTNLATWSERRERTQQSDAENVQNILELHAMCQPLGAIAKAVGVPDTVAAFVIQRGRLPQKQRGLLDVAGEIGQ